MKYALCLALSGCTPMPGWHSSVLSGGDGRGVEYHSCGNGGECAEGWACVPDGCEFCGSEPGVETRCTAGDDGGGRGTVPVESLDAAAMTLLRKKMDAFKGRVEQVRHEVQR